MGGATLGLAACGGGQPVASDEFVARMAFRDPGPSYLTLFTMVNNRSGQGAHSALMINASQRVIWDPAGSFFNSQVPERNDLVYGVSPRVYEVYRSAHARETHHVMEQKIIVSPDAAEKAYQLAAAHGKATSATCAISTSGILSQLPGFEAIRQVWYPSKLAEQFAALPGVETNRHFENDAGDKVSAFGAAAEAQILPGGN